MSKDEENISRVYTINLGRAWLTPQYKRTDRVINMIKEFAEKHMKSPDVKLDQDLNRQIWSRGKTNPPRKLRVKMEKDDDGIVTVLLYEERVAEKAEEAREKVSEKVSAPAGEIAEAELGAKSPDSSAALKTREGTEEKQSDLKEKPDASKERKLD